MKKGLKVFGIFVVLAVLLVGGVSTWWKQEFPSGSWRYRITVDVETPEGLKTGSVVRETQSSVGIRIGDSGGGGAGTIGEAIVVDLGKRGCLIGTLPEGDELSKVIGNYPPATPEGIKYYSNLKEGKASLMQKGLLPHFVTFKNMNDPMTVENVDGRDLSKTFGDGVKLKDITLEVTTEPITWGNINIYLPWLEGLKGGYLDGQFLGGGPSLSNILHAGNFQHKGLKK